MNDFYVFSCLLDNCKRIGIVFDVGILKAFGNRLKKIRINSGLTQKKVADMLQIQTSTYANWEQGRRSPDVFDIFKLLSIFKISANELLDNLLVDIDAFEVNKINFVSIKDRH